MIIMSFEIKFKKAYGATQNIKVKEASKVEMVGEFVRALDAEYFFSGLSTGLCDGGLRVYRDGAKVFTIKYDSAPDIDDEKSFKEWFVDQVKLIDEELNTHLLKEPKKTTVQVKKI